MAGLVPAIHVFRQGLSRRRRQAAQAIGGTRLAVELLQSPFFQTAAAVKDRLRRSPCGGAPAQGVRRTPVLSNGLWVASLTAAAVWKFRNREFDGEVRSASSASVAPLRTPWLAPVVSGAVVFPPRPRRASSTGRMGARFGVRCDAESLGDDRAATTTLSPFGSAESNGFARRRRGRR